MAKLLTLITLHIAKYHVDTLNKKQAAEEISALKFYRANEIFAQARPAREEMKHRLSKLLKV